MRVHRFLRTLKKPDPIVVLGAVFLLGIVALLAYSSSIAYAEEPFDHARFAARYGPWLFLMLMSLIPAGPVLLSFASNGPFSLITLVHLSALLGVPSLVHKRLLRFSPVIAMCGGALAYIAICFGGNLLCLHFFDTNSH